MVLGALACACLQCRFGYSEQALERHRQRHVVKQSFTAKSLRKAVRELVRTTKLPICLEEVPLPPVQRRTQDDLQRLRQHKSAGVSLVVTNAPLDAVLDARCRVDDQYVWTTDGETGFINVFPKTNAPLSWKIDQIAITNLTMRQVLFTDILRLREHRIIPDLHPGNLAWLDSSVSLVGTNMSLRSALNHLCSQVNPVHRWEVFDPLRARSGSLVMWFFPVMRDRAEIDQGRASALNDRPAHISETYTVAIDADGEGAEGSDLANR